MNLAHPLVWPVQTFGRLLKRLVLVGALVALGAGAGCATSMTQLTTARALEPLHAQVAVNYSIPLHTNLWDAAWDTAESLEKGLDENEVLTVEDTYKMFDAALQYALFLNTGAPEIIGRIGVSKAVLEGIDVGVRYNGNMVKGDVKLQVWESENRSGSLAVDVGYGYQFSVVGSLLEYLSLSDWSRSDLDLAFIYSVEPNSIFKGWVGPRMMFSFISADPKIDPYLKDRLPEAIRQYDTSQYFQDENMAYLGATTGMMLGYKYAYVGLELTVMRMFFKPTVLERKKDFDGVVFAPAIAITALW